MTRAGRTFGSLLRRRLQGIGAAYGIKLSGQIDGVSGDLRFFGNPFTQFDGRRKRAFERNNRYLSTKPAASLTPKIIGSNPIPTTTFLAVTSTSVL